MVSWWRLLRDDEDALMEAINAHHLHSQLLFARAAERYPQSFGGATIETVDAQCAAALDKRFGRHGARSWHGKRLDELVREVEAAADEETAGHFWHVFHLVTRQNNYTLHHSPLGLMDSIDWTDVDETPVIRVGPSPDGRREALWAASRVFGLLVLATLRRFSPERIPEFSEVFTDAMLDLTPLSREQARGVGRNDSCPCGSGEKFKRCHGPRMSPDDRV